MYGISNDAIKIQHISTGVDVDTIFQMLFGNHLMEYRDKPVDPLEQSSSNSASPSSQEFLIRPSSSTSKSSSSSSVSVSSSISTTIRAAGNMYLQIIASHQATEELSNHLSITALESLMSTDDCTTYHSRASFYRT
jgi:hypothetical protein